MSLIFGDRQTEWDEDSLALLRARYAAPLKFSIPGLYPIPAIPCANPRCSNVRIRKRTSRGKFEGLRGASDYCAPCYDRWRRSQFPASGPPDPMSNEDRLALARAAQEAQPPGCMAQPQQEPLKSGDYGYRPSTGTAGMSVAA